VTDRSSVHVNSGGREPTTADSGRAAGGRSPTKRAGGTLAPSHEPSPAPPGLTVDDAAARRDAVERDERDRPKSKTARSGSEVGRAATNRQSATARFAATVLAAWLGRVGDLPWRCPKAPVDSGALWLLVMLKIVTPPPLHRSHSLPQEEAAGPVVPAAEPGRNHPRASLSPDVGRRKER